MKRFAIAGVIAMALLFATMLPAVAQDDHPDNHNNDAHQQEPHDQNQAQPDRDRQMQTRQDDNRQQEQERAAHDQHANARRIDEAHYRQHFGQSHHFAIHNVQHINGRDQFAYGGYQFQLGQSWPAGWSYNDDCYIEDVGGQYYLYDLRHPGVRVMVMVL